ncbi:MAG TPA: nucleotidyl transferase AbiEii/AbiGii toxin family protein, partial [Candidatus Limnocylindria bacterium]|nr:nucleotidyl transferase AbiEii/AbiGii toxin family protein [Candidatus Limnocylindria bacterium]
RRPVGVAETPERGAARTIEQFHIAFLEVASSQLPLGEYVVKDGVNIRFFFGSGRRSKDVDFDYVGDRFEGFGNRVAATLRSEALRRLLATREIEVGNVRDDKQTNTTRRWRFKLSRPGVADASSKLEFSNRPSSGGFALEPIDAELARRLQGRAPRLNHYLAPAAIAQKISALVRRAETQPRDVFDLDHLFVEAPRAMAEADVRPDEVEAAIARAFELTYDEYVSTVVDYLDEDFVQRLGTRDAWEDMVLRVTGSLRSWLETHGGE